MTDVTRILSAIEQGDPTAADQLLPLVYDGLRKLAAQKMAQEKPGQSRATAEYCDEDPSRIHIILGSWFYPLSIALTAHPLRDTGFEGPYRLNPMSLHEYNVFSLKHV